MNLVEIEIGSTRDSLNVMAKFEFNRLVWGYPLKVNQSLKLGKGVLRKCLQFCKYDKKNSIFTLVKMILHFIGHCWNMVLEHYLKKYLDCLFKLLYHYFYFDHCPNFILINLKTLNKVKNSFIS